MKVGSINCAFYTSPHATIDLDPEPALLELIDNAKATIDVGIYSLTLTKVAQALIAARTRGVVVRVLADATEAKGATSQIPALIAAGVDVRVWGGNYRLAHFKVIVVDGHSVALGSYNFSGLAENDDYEVMLTATGIQVSRILAPQLTALIESAYATGNTITGGTT